jgi:hypothetical protein
VKKMHPGIEGGLKGIIDQFETATAESHLDQLAHVFSIQGFARSPGHFFFSQTEESWSSNVNM